MTQRDTNLRGISREWLAARIVLLGGFVIAIAVAAYFTLRPAPVVQQQPAAQTEDQAAVLARKEANAKAAIMVCAMELLNAKNTGIVPSYGQLASMLPRKTATRGRYACIAGTNVT
ncbi:MAG TPA: hypothetical protein VN932_11420, partial [Rhizomicrobium sp.]|nr:hypothetical protein [Rhizomicrobium sp.]